MEKRGLERVNGFWFAYVYFWGGQPKLVIYTV